MLAKVSKYLISTALAGSLAGCAMTDLAFWSDEQGAEQNTHKVTVLQESAPAHHIEQVKQPTKPSMVGQYRGATAPRITQDSQQPTALWVTPKSLYAPDFTHKSLADYASHLAMKIMQNGAGLKADSRIGVASFVVLDESLRQSTPLGNQLAELCIAEMQQFGLPVVDFKTMDSIVVDRSGDFVFSRQDEELSKRLALDYILSGTLIATERGVRVNSRLVSMGSKVVVSSATMMIPHFVVTEMTPKFVQL